MRIAIFPTLPADDIPSMDRYSLELHAALAGEESLDATLFRPPARGVAQVLGAPGRLAHKFVRYPAAIRGCPADLFHVTDQSYAHLAAVLPRQRTIITCHDLMVLRSAQRGWDLGARRMTVPPYRFSTSFLRRAAAVVCVSEATRRDVIGVTQVEPDHTVVIPNGVGDRFRPLSLRDGERNALRVGYGAARRILMHTSSGIGYKNVEGTLAVLARLLARGHDVILVRAGGRLTEPQRAYAERLGVGRRVVDLGRVPDEALVDLYNVADALVFPSHWEGFGWPPLEALACGTPVVISDIPPLVETTGGAALAAPSGDAHALAAAVERLWGSHELRSALRAKGLERVDQLRWPRIAERYARLYTEVKDRLDAPRIRRRRGFG